MCWNNIVDVGILDVWRSMSAFILFSPLLIHSITIIQETGRLYFMFSEHSTLVGARAHHQLGLDQGIKLLLSQCIQLEGTLLKGKALLVSVLGHLTSHIVSNLRVKAGDKHKTIKLISIGFILV